MPGAIPTAAAAPVTSRRTASETAAPPAACSNAAACSSATRSSSCGPAASRPRGGAHGGPRVGALGEQAQGRGEVVHLAVAHRDLERDVVRQLGEPAGVGHDERLPERQRADRGAGGLPHRRRAQADVDVARGHQRPEPRLVHVALAEDAVGGEPEPLQAPVEVEPGRGRADEEQSRSRMLGPDARERLEQLRHPLARVHVAERADQRLGREVGRGDAADRARRGAGSARSAPRSRPPGRARRRSASGRRARSRGRAPRPRAGSPPGRASQSGGRRLSSTPWASRRPTTPCSRSIASR